MKKQKFLGFLNKILFSSLFLWGLLIFLKIFNLKPEINISLFFFLSLFLFLILSFKQILIFLILFLNKINIRLKLTKKLIDIKSRNFLYLFPLFIRQFSKFLKGSPLFLKFILINRFFWLTLAIFMILLDIFVFKFISDLLIFFLICLWVLSICSSKFKIEASIGLALGFLILCPFLLIFKKELIAEKAAIWGYMFLVVGVFQVFVKSLKEKRKDAEIKKK
jgi:hypothetical protein